MAPIYRIPMSSKPFGVSRKGCVGEVLRLFSAQLFLDTAAAAPA